MPTLPSEGWVYEEKIDGWRMLAYKEGGNVRLVSRNGVDHTRPFGISLPPWLRFPSGRSCWTARWPSSNRQFRSRFDWLREPEPEAAATPPLLLPAI